MRELRMVGVLCATAVLSSCLIAAIIVGAGIGAVVVHASGEDSREASFEGNWQDAAEATSQILHEMGTVRLEDRPGGHFEGTVGSSDVAVTITQTEKNMHILVQARKNVANVSPDPETATQVLEKIVERLGGKIETQKPK